MCLVVIQVPPVLMKGGMTLWQFDTLMVAVPLLLLTILRRNLADYGLRFTDWRQDLRVALTAYLPASLGILPTAFVAYQRWSGAIVLAASLLSALFVIAWLLHRKLIPLMGVITIALTVIGFGWAALSRGTLPPVGSAVKGFVLFAIFVGIGEEVLWRGYVQSRLNQAFGRPYTFCGVQWGLGLVIASVLFGFVHVLNTSAATGQVGWYWPWGFWNVFSGLLFGYVRERTGNVLAPAFLHGIPHGLGAALGL